MKRKKVLLTVTGITSDFGETDDAMRSVTMGTLTGENDTRRVTMTMDGGVVTMARDGSWGTNMVFRQGRRFETSYTTPFGSFGMGIFPTQVNYKVEDSGDGEIALRYQLDIQGQFTSVNDLKISFSPSSRA